jgi:alpha-L-fucosidase 2
LSVYDGVMTARGDGSVTSPRAPGGYEVDMQWKNGKLQSAEIHSSQGGGCKLRSGERTVQKSFKPGEVVRVDGNLESIH